MAQVIPSEASGLLKSLYGEIQAPLASLITEYSEAFERDSIAMKIFAKRKSTHSVESYGGITGVDSWGPVGEAGQVSTGGFQEDYFQTIRNITWGGSMMVTRELMDDSGFKDIMNKPKMLVKDYNLKLENFCARLIGEALKGNSSFTMDGFAFPTTCKDTKKVFATDHPAKVKGANQSNLYAGDFNADNLYALMTKMRQFRDADGKLMAVKPTTIIIPDVATLSKDVYQAVGSTLDPDSANNAINLVGGKLEVMQWGYLNDFISGGTCPYILFDRDFNEMYDGNVFQERVEAEYRDRVDDRQRYIWEGYARFNAGFVDWRQMIVGGVTGGSSLT